ncbi:MAG: TPR end-of-group domain-containing protein [Thermomicrobiales bacterium]
MTNLTDPATFIQILARAEARSADEHWHEAAGLWQRIVETNPVDGHFWSQLACAWYGAEEFRDAIPAFACALELRDGFPAETAYRIARCHARLGETDNAIAWLERAWDLGFRHLDQAQTDDDLTSLRDHPRFRDLVGLIDADDLTRDEGWRVDLRFFAREVKRRAYAPFGQISEERFDRLIAALDEAIPNLTDAQIILELTKILRHLGDGHAYVSPPEDRDDLQRAIPLIFYQFEEGIFVTAADAAHRGLLGGQLLRIGDRPIEEVVAAVEPLVCRDNDHWPKEVVPRRLRELSLLHALGLVPDPDAVALTLLLPDGSTRTVALVADTSQRHWKRIFPYPADWVSYPETLDSPRPLSLKNLSLPYWFEYLPAARVVYVQFNAVRNDPSEAFADFLRRLFAFVDEHLVDKLVLDMRWNGGGNTYLELPLLRQLITSKVNRRGRLWVIIGRRTFSAAQNGVGMISVHTEAIFAGEPTGSSPTFIGETIPFELPYSKVQANVADLLWQNTWPTDERPWVAPTLYTPPTFAAYRANRDPALDAILACTEHLPNW